MSRAKFNKKNIDHLTKSLERLSIYDGHGKVHILQISPKADYAKILGDLDVDTIEEKIKQLKEYEKQCSEAGDLEEAEKATNQINELLEKEILLENLGIIEKNQREFEELKNMNDMQISEFNHNWDSIIKVLTESSKKIEEDLLLQHQREREKLDAEIEKIEIPKAKLSSDLLNKKVQLKYLIKGKRYGEARILKSTVEEMEERETGAWGDKFRDKLARKKELLLKKQKNEYDALKTRLEKSINTKLKQRMIEYEKLLQRIQNMQNELIINQNRHFSRVQAINAKILAKYSLNLVDLEQKALESEQEEKKQRRREEETTRRDDDDDEMEEGNDKMEYLEDQNQFAPEPELKEHEQYTSQGHYVQQQQYGQPQYTQQGEYEQVQPELERRESTDSDSSDDSDSDSDSSSDGDSDSDSSDDSSDNSDSDSSESEVEQHNYN